MECVSLLILIDLCLNLGFDCFDVFVACGLIWCFVFICCELWLWI